MGKVSFSVAAWTAAPPAAVFSLLTDGATWPAWTPIWSFQLERPAPGGGEGVGAIRRFRTGWLTSREEITAVEPDDRFAYRTLSGIPIRNHQASVELRPERGGSAVEWREEFETSVPGMGRFIHAFIGSCAKGLAKRAAEVQSGR